MMRTFLTALSIATGGLLAACSTPQPALDQANHGASLISQLEGSLGEFRRIEQHAQNARLRSLQDQLAAIEEVKKSTMRDARARTSAGDHATPALIARMLGDADGLAADAAAAQAARAANDAALASLLAPLPSTAASTTEAQKKLAEMGSELSRETRLREFLSFAKAIKKSIDENRQKIAEAEAAAKK
jgi:hypothetical protein